MEISKKDFSPQADYNGWYDSVYHTLTGYGLWLRGGELNTLPKEEYARRPFRALFVRLSTYRDVAHSFTHQVLYRIAAETEGVFPDLAYLPPENDTAVFRKSAVPWLLGTQTKFGPQAFSLIGFSNSIVQELINIPSFLVTSGIPLRRSERLVREDLPLIVLGGANALYTSSIRGADSLVDGIFVGEDPACIRDLLCISAEGKKNGMSKQSVLKNLEKIPGFYQSDAVSEKSSTARLRPRACVPVVGDIVPYDIECVGSGHLRISEGCRALCSFCAENWTRKPYRETDVAALISSALEMKARMGLEEIELFSFNFNMHTKIYELLWELAPFFNRIGLKSQRIDMLSREPVMIECQKALGKMTFSAGVEGISPRLRRYLNKNLSDAALYKSIDLIFAARARELKIFMLSTGREEEPDYIELEKTLTAIRSAKEKRRALTRVIFSITPLVRFPWTPLEFDEAPGVDVHTGIMDRMKRIIGKYGFEAREAMDAREYLVSQILVRSPEAGTVAALIRSVEQAGFVYYRSISSGFILSFLEELKREGIEPAELFKAFSYEGSLEKPWAKIETGMERKFLWDTFQKNTRFTEIGQPMDSIAIEAPRHLPLEYKERLHPAGTPEVDIAFSVSIGPASRGISRKYVGIALAAALMRSEPLCAPCFCSYRSAECGFEWATGDDVITLSWMKDAVQVIKERCAEPSFLKRVNLLLEGRMKLNGIAGGQKKTRMVTVDSPHRFDASEYFKRKGLKYTLYKNSDGVQELKFSKDSLKKDIIAGCCLVPGPQLVRLSVRAGSKLNVEEFIRQAFVYPDKNSWVRVNVTLSFDR